VGTGGPPAARRVRMPSCPGNGDRRGGAGEEASAGVWALAAAYVLGGPRRGGHEPDRAFTRQACGTMAAIIDSRIVSGCNDRHTCVLKENTMYEKEVESILRDLEQGDKAGAGWMWNPATKRIERAGNGGPDCLYLGGKDLGHAGSRRICR